MKLTPEQLRAKQEREQIKIMKQQTEDLEIKARYWEAQWKIRFYTLEAEKLQPEYDTFIKAQQEKQQEMIKRFQEQIDAMNKAAQDKEESKVLAENEEFLSAIVPEEENPLTAV